VQGEFRELHELKCAAEIQFSEAYGIPVETHTIWIIQKKARDGEEESEKGGGGGFEPHIDQFTPNLGHIGTISTPVAFLRTLEE
jgi:hypothetical protein